MFYIFFLSIALLLFPSVSFGEITKIIIEKRAPFANGYEFPVAGAYEKLVGKAYGELDPKSPLNKMIIDLDKTRKNSRGREEYWTDIFLLKPAELSRGNGKISYDEPHRAGKHIHMFCN